MSCDATSNDAEPQFVGFITQIQPAMGATESGWIWVESHADKLVHRHTVAITERTKIFVFKDEAFRPVGFDRFHQKQWVKVWFAGPVRDANQTEVTARKVVIVDRP